MWSRPRRSVKLWYGWLSAAALVFMLMLAPHMATSQRRPGGSVFVAPPCFLFLATPPTGTVSRSFPWSFCACCQVKAAIKKARAAGEASAKKAAAKAAKAAKAAGAGDSSDDEEVKQSGARSGAGTRTEAGAGAGAGPGSGSGRTGSSTAPTSLTAEEKGDFSKLREASKYVVVYLYFRTLCVCRVCAHAVHVVRLFVWFCGLQLATCRGE